MRLLSTKLLQEVNEENKIEDKAEKMIEIAYKIRCRLFHGEKDY
jgi:hypothetical protein